MIAEVKKSNRAKRSKKIYDSLTMISQDEKGDSVWRGKNGSRYVFCKLGGGGKKPVAKVIRDGVFLTGLFRTKNRGVYSGDILLSDGSKKYLQAKVVERGRMDIYIFR